MLQPSDGVPGPRHPGRGIIVLEGRGRGRVLLVVCLMILYALSLQHCEASRVAGPSGALQEDKDGPWRMVTEHMPKSRLASRREAEATHSAQKTSVVDGDDEQAAGQLSENLEFEDGGFVTNEAESQTWRANLGDLIRKTEAGSGSGGNGRHDGEGSTKKATFKGTQVTSSPALQSAKAAENGTHSTSVGGIEDSSEKFPEFEKIPARHIGGVSTGVNVQVASGHLEDREIRKPVVHGAITASKYAEILREKLRRAEQVHAVPIVRLRWHTHPDFIRKAAELRSSTGEHYFYVTIGDSVSVDSSIAQRSIFRSRIPERLVPINWTGSHDSCPFRIPSFDDLIAASLNFEPEILKLLRWVPYPLLKKPSDTEESDIRTERDFMDAVAQTLPSKPFFTEDGRKVALVIHDKLPELQYLVDSSSSFAPNGTPVFTTSSDEGKLNSLLPRLKAKFSDGSPMIFLLISYERGCHPFDEAFLDHSVVRVPTFNDLKTFVQSNIKELKKSQDQAIISLNPYQDLLMRFNYKEVESINGYIAELEHILRESPIKVDVGGAMHTVTIIVLSRSPEESLVYFKGSSRLNLAIQLTLVVLMLIALLSCFCMCRFVCLVKSKEV